MEVLLAIVVGILYAGGLYLMMRRSIVKLIIGLVFLSNAINLLIFVAAGLVPDGGERDAGAGPMGLVSGRAG